MVSVLSLICIESFVALSTYLLLITGQISFGQQAYFGIGAFSGGAMTAMWGFDLSTALIVGGLVAGAAAALAGAIAGIGGVLFAHYMTFIDPRNFGVMLGVHSLAYGLIGGLGTFVGPLIGVVIDIGLLESLRVFSGYRMIVFGSLVALILIFRPRGILDEKTVHRISTSVRAWFGRRRVPRADGFG